MRAWFTRVGLTVLVLAGVVLGSLAGRPGRPVTPASADTVKIIALQGWPCLALTTSLGCAGLYIPTNIDGVAEKAAGMTHAEALARGSLDGSSLQIQPSDLAGIDLDANQAQQQDGSLWVVAFVSNSDPVTFFSSVGSFQTPTSGVQIGTQLTCGPAGQVTNDADCLGGTRGDGVVVARLNMNGAPLGPATVRVRQDFIEPTLNFTVVGEPVKIQFQTFKTTIQTTTAPIASSALAQAAPYGSLTLNVTSDLLAGRTLPADIIIDPSLPGLKDTVTVISKNGLTYNLQAGKLSTDGTTRLNGTGVTAAFPVDHAAGAAVQTASTCTFPTSAAGFATALGATDKTILFAKALDNNGTSVANAIVTFTSSDPTVMTPALGIVPTLDLGAFGVGGPMVVCGGMTGGKVTLNMALAQCLPPPFPGICVDSHAFSAAGSVDFTVLGPPASMTLTAKPSTLVCDGTSTSTVEADVVDSLGNKAADGPTVTFDTQTLATADPINTKLAGGKATSTITPLSIGIAGVPVTVHVGTLSSSILIQCQAGGAVSPAGSVPPPAGGGGGPSGAITGPDTGSGPAGGTSGALSWWPALALALGGIALAAARLNAHWRWSRRRS